MTGSVVQGHTCECRFGCDLNCVCVCFSVCNQIHLWAAAHGLQMTGRPYDWNVLSSREEMNVFWLFESDCRSLVWRPRVKRLRLESGLGELELKLSSSVILASDEAALPRECGGEISFYHLCVSRDNRLVSEWVEEVSPSGRLAPQFKLTFKHIRASLSKHGKCHRSLFDCLL